MALEVYYKEDIRNALLAAEQAMSATATASGGDDQLVTGFLAGYRAALATLVLAFGLLPGKPDRALETNWGWLLTPDSKVGEPENLLGGMP